MEVVRRIGVEGGVEPSSHQGIKYGTGL